MVKRTEYKTREEWLSLRSSFEDKLGGSEIGVVAGHSPYRSAFNLFCEKVGVVEPEDLSEKEAIRQGHDLEQYVADRFTDLTGMKVSEELCIFTNDEAPHLKATIDRKVEDGESGLECKTIKDRVMSKYMKGDFPQSYYDQCVCYLKVTGLKRWYLAMLVFGTEFKVFCMTTDEAEKAEYDRLKGMMERQDSMTLDEMNKWEHQFKYLEALYYVSQGELDATETIAAEFMKRVEAFQGGNLDAWPNEELDSSESTSEALMKMHSNVIANSVVTFDEMNIKGLDQNGNAVEDVDRDLVLSLITEYKDCKAKAKEYAEAAEGYENRIAGLMKERETFIVPGAKITYKYTTPRKIASVKEVEKYFMNKGEQIPEGLITESTTKRNIRLWGKK